MKITALPFISNHLGVSSGRLELKGPISALPELMDEAANLGFKFLECRIRPWTFLEEALEGVGFKLIETLDTFCHPPKWKLPDPPPEGYHKVQLAHPEDTSIMVGCAQVAQCAFSLDRFHVDPLIPNHIADGLKMAWTINAFIERRADRIYYTMTPERRVAGFCLMNRKGHETAVIDLIAVHPKFRRQGYAEAMVAAAVKYYLETADEIFVGTQTTNKPSHGLYTKFGFFGRSCHQTYHWHQTSNQKAGEDQ